MFLSVCEGVITGSEYVLIGLYVLLRGSSEVLNCCLLFFSVCEGPLEDIE